MIMIMIKRFHTLHDAYVIIITCLNRTGVWLPPLRQTSVITTHKASGRTSSDNHGLVVALLALQQRPAGGQEL